MKIIKIAASENGSRPPLQDWPGAVPPAGYAAFPEKFLPVFYPADKQCAGFVDITVEDGGSWKLAAPASWGAYLHAPAQLKRDLAQARWKPAFLQRLFGVPLPYGKVYAALKHKK